jgi:hypothetical protein
MKTTDKSALLSLLVGIVFGVGMAIHMCYLPPKPISPLPIKHPYGNIA